MANLNIDLTHTEASKPREVLQPGWYVAVIDASEVKATKKAQEAQAYPTQENAVNKYDCLLQLTLKVVEGDHKGRQIWHRLNIRNANEIAQKIAEEELAAICDAIKHPRKVTDSVTLHGKAMRVKVDVETREGQPPQNVIKGFEPLPGGGLVALAEPGAGAATPAWNRK